MENEIVSAVTDNGIMVARDPEAVLTEARKAANALMTVVRLKKKPFILNGEQYLEFEDWMTLARFYGVSVRVRSTQLIDLGGVRGYEATADAIRNVDNCVISSADAMCLNDEEKWSTRPKYIYESGVRKQVGEVSVPLFQLRSMAQTRACAKALRNVFAWVVVLAGYRPTPAEEMTDDISTSAKAQKPPVNMPQKKSAPSQPDSAESIALLNVLDALQQPVGVTFDVWGILFDFKTIKTKTGKDMTFYKINARESTDLMDVSLFGPARTEIIPGNVLKFTGVKVSLFNEAKTYLAQALEVLPEL